jgi:hypothetical protein
MAGALLLSASCSDAASDDDAPSSASAPTISTTATSAAPAALAFSAPTVGGGTLDLSTYAGKTVALWFWAPY